jgi:hypothetical protein
MTCPHRRLAPPPPPPRASSTAACRRRINETLDGHAIHLNEDAESGEPLITIRKSLVERQREITADNWHVRACDKRPNLPKSGLLEFDYVTLKARTATTVSSSKYRFDLSKPEDRLVAESLKAMGADMVGENWVDESIDGAPLQMNVRALVTRPLADCARLLAATAAWLGLASAVALVHLDLCDFASAGARIPLHSRGARVSGNKWRAL